MLEITIKVEGHKLKWLPRLTTFFVLSVCKNSLKSDKKEREIKLLPLKDADKIDKGFAMLMSLGRHNHLYAKTELVTHAKIF